MASANTNLRVSELDFDEIKGNFKAYLGNQNNFQDYNFEGAGMNILLDQLSYTTHYMGMYANLLANEMFGDTAQLRSSILSHAKHLNYRPRSVTGSVAMMNILVTPNEISEDTTANTITLAKYTKLISTAKDGQNYQFVTLNANSAVKVSGSFQFSNVIVKQGEVITQQFLMTGTNDKARFVLPSANVDTSTVQVSVQDSIANTTTTNYTLENDLTEVRANSTVFWLEENTIDEGNWVIQFGDNYIGRRPANNAIIFATYLESVGEESNDLDSFVFTDPIAGEYTANVIINAQRSTSGAPKESIEQIRHRAPIHYTSQNRAVTEEDYELLLLRDYPNIDAVSVWSGADNDPPVYGKVFISLLPKSNYGITASEKLRIVNQIIEKRSIMTVIPEIVDPDYTYLILRVDVHYESNDTSLNEAQIKSLVRQKILDYRDNNLRTFNSVFRNSVLHREIDSAEKSILSNNIEIYLQKRAELTVNETLDYSLDYQVGLRRTSFPFAAYSTPHVNVRDNIAIEREAYFEVVPDSFTGIDSISIVTAGQNYTSVPTVTISGDGTGATATASVINGKLSSITLTSRGANYSRATVAITGGGGTGATGSPVLGLSNGDLRTFYYNSNGEKIIITENAGTIDFASGAVKFTNLLPLSVESTTAYPDNTVTFNCPPDDENINPSRNRILDIDANDPNSIQINMIPE